MKIFPLQNMQDNMKGIWHRAMERNSINYRWAYKSLEKFAGCSNDVIFSKLTTKFIQDWMKTLEETSKVSYSSPNFLSV